MKPLEIKGARTRLGYTQQFVADELNLSLPSYRKKESGKVKFTDEEKMGLAKVLQLSPYQTNDYLYDGILPIGKLEERACG